MLDVLLLATSLAHAQSATLWQPGATITDAVSFQVTETGLDKLGDALPALVPPDMPLQDVNQSCGADTLTITGAWAGFQVDDLRLVPSNGRLDLEADLQVRINDQTDPMDMEGCLLDGCDLYVAPFPVSVSLPITLAVVDDPEVGHNVIDVTLGTLAMDHGLTEGHIHSIQVGWTPCPISLLSGAISGSGFSLIDWVWQIAEPILLIYVEQQVLPDIEAQIEEQLQAAYFADTVALGEVELDIEIEPQQVLLSPDGLDIRVQGHAGAEQGPCMVDRDPGGSLKTATAVPALSDNTTNTEFALLLSDDIANEGLYAVWRSGLLCYDLANSTIDLPFPLNTSLLGIVGGEGYQELFPESQPIDVVTSPDLPPTVDYQSNHDLTAVVRELGVDFFTEVDYRRARALGVDLEVDAGVDLNFDGTTGALDIAVDLDDDAIRVVPTHVQLVAGSGPTVQENFGTILDVVIDQFLGDQLDGLSFLIPSFQTESGQRLGLSTLSASDAGAESDWLRAKAGIGIVQYDNTDAENSCGGSGGCSNVGATAPGWFALLPLLWWRRRVTRAC